MSVTPMKAEFALLCSQLQQWIRSQWDLIVLLVLGLSLPFLIIHGHLFFAVLVSGALAVLAVFRVPQRQVAAYRHGLGSEQVAALENEFRKTIAQILGGGALLLGLYVTWKQLVATQEGQITDRFSRAVTQLGDTSVAVQLGGIFALERIARDSPQDHWTVVEVLTAFIRERFPAEPNPLTDQQCEPTEATPRPRRWTERARPAPEVEAVFTVLRRRNWENDRGALDLSRSHIVGVSITKTSLRGANLQGSILEDVTFDQTDLRGANVREAYLLNAHFFNTDFSGSFFESSHLQGGTFGSSRFENVRFDDAHLIDERFDFSRLKGVYFRHACLIRVSFMGLFRGVALEGADLLHDLALTRSQLDSAQTDVLTIFPPGQEDGVTRIGGTEWHWRLLRGVPELASPLAQLDMLNTSSWFFEIAFNPTVVFWLPEDPGLRVWAAMDTAPKGQLDSVSLARLFEAAYGRTARDSAKALWRVDVRPASLCRDSGIVRLLEPYPTGISVEIPWRNSPRSATALSSNQLLDLIRQARAIDRH